MQKTSSHGSKARAALNPRANDGTQLREEKGNVGDKNGVTLSGLLNVLDGFYAPTNVLVTNRIETLDEALLRPGRIDYKLYLGKATDRQKMDLYRRFFPEASESEGKAFVETYGLVETIAEFQGLLLGSIRRAGTGGFQLCSKPLHRDAYSTDNRFNSPCDNLVPNRKGVEIRFGCDWAAGAP